LLSTQSRSMRRKEFSERSAYVIVDYTAHSTAAAAEIVNF